MPWIRNRLSWSMRPSAAGRRTPARNRGPERSCRTTSTARPAVAVPRAGRPAPPITGAARARRSPEGATRSRPRAAPASGRGTTSSPREAIPRDACLTRRPADRRGLRRRRGGMVRLCGGRPALSGASGGGDSEEADQGVEGAAPLARRVERVGGTSGGVRPRPGRRRAEGPAARVSAGRSWPVSSSCPSSSRGPSCVTRAPPRAPLTVGRPRRDHPSADQLRVRVRHAAILRHREGHFHCDGYLHRDGIITSIWDDHLHRDDHVHRDDPSIGMIGMITSIGMVPSIGMILHREDPPSGGSLPSG